MAPDPTPCAPGGWMVASARASACVAGWMVAPAGGSFRVVNSSIPIVCYKDGRGVEENCAPNGYQSRSGWGKAGTTSQGPVPDHAHADLRASNCTMRWTESSAPPVRLHDIFFSTIPTYHRIFASILHMPMFYPRAVVFHPRLRPHDECPALVGSDGHPRIPGLGPLPPHLPCQ